MTFIYNIPLFNINVPKIPFRANPEQYIPDNSPQRDSFCSNPLYENFKDKNTLLQTAKSNPNIIDILKTNNMPVNINIDELEKLKKGHLNNTRILVAKMYSELPKDLKININQSDLQQAALLHDFGKILIPDKILNKTSGLNQDEKDIVQLHSILGYEMLKNQGVNDDVLRLVKYHHQDAYGNGYPVREDDFEYDIAAQILKTADKYSALTEKRSYKDEMDKDTALAIIREDINSQIIMPEIYDALSKSV